VAAISKTRIAIWAVLAIAVLLAGLAYVRLSPGIVDTKETKAKQQLIVLRAALEKFRADNGHYPSQVEGLRALVDQSPQRGYLANEFALKDPWGRPIVYRLDSSSKGEGFTLYSLGPSGTETDKPNEALVVHN
jgi:general secretion pathway protein G